VRLERKHVGGSKEGKGKLKGKKKMSKKVARKSDSAGFSTNAMSWEVPRTHMAVGGRSIEVRGIFVLFNPTFLNKIRGKKSNSFSYRIGKKMGNSKKKGKKSRKESCAGKRRTVVGGGGGGRPLNGW